MISRDKVPALQLPEEEVRVESFDDTVLVRGLSFGQAMAFSKRGVREDNSHVAELLTDTIFAGDGLPLYAAHEWEAFGNVHPDEMVELYKVARRLSGLDESASEKK